MPNYQWKARKTQIILIWIILKACTLQKTHLLLFQSFRDVVSIHTNTKEFKDIKINLYDFKDDADQHATSEAIIID